MLYHVGFEPTAFGTVESCVTRRILEEYFKITTSYKNIYLKRLLYNVYNAHITTFSNIYLKRLLYVRRSVAFFIYHTFVFKY